MTTKDTTASYAELSGETYSTFVDAMTSANQRALDYAKSVWEIVSRPYSSSAIEAAVRENFDRANQISSLTMQELQTSGKHSAALAEKLAAQAAKLQETYVHALRGVVDTGISNVNFVKESATQMAAAPVSNN
jgi:hypothetical protein